MSASRRSRGRRGGHGHEEGHENDERWLLTYADMITLLMALFMVLFSISSVNKSKFVTLQRALKEAFSGKILPGGRSIQQAGSDATSERPAPDAPFSSVSPTVNGPAKTTDKGQATQGRDAAARRENESFQRLKRQVDAYAVAHKLDKQIETRIDRRGLLIRLRTDRVLFASGSAVLEPAGHPLVDRVGRLVAGEQEHPVQVEGHTDSIPIATSAYPSNWELSTARALSVTREFLHVGVAPARLSATGFGAYHPIASNGTAAGRTRNRRVDIVLTRLYTEAQGRAR